MKTEITTYIPKRNILGRFKTSKRTKAKILFVLMALSSFYLNYHLAKQHYNIKCSAGGYFTSKQECDRLVQDKMDALELLRVQYVQENPDIFTSN